MKYISNKYIYNKQRKVWQTNWHYFIEYLQYYSKFTQYNIELKTWVGRTIVNGYICIEQDVSLKNDRVNIGLEILFNDKIQENQQLRMQKQYFAKVKKYTIVFSIIFVNAKTFLGQV